VQPPTDYRPYSGSGLQLSRRGLELPLYREPSALSDPSGYVADKGLTDAVNVAILIGQPLLVTGEPGTGKTQLAPSVAYELELPPALVFHTKTTSTAQDLFYRYDAIAHFHDAQTRDGHLRTEDYITFEALGLAIIRAAGYKTGPRTVTLGELMRDAEGADVPLGEETVAASGRPVRSVVLIDEIDKAPRDFPNDILNELESMSFVVKETGQRFSTGSEYRPIVILTSNSEKNLPDAFLRRCIFYHIPFPDQERLREIVRRRLKLTTTFTERQIDDAIDHFLKIRSLPLSKKPATAELLAWLRTLETMGIRVAEADPKTLVSTYPVLVKTYEDLKTAETFAAQVRVV
jgi:MoxR-like ATPase